MPLTVEIYELIRDEIGQDTDFADDEPHTPPQFDSLENIYEDTGRGNLSPLRTALICWRLRLHNLQNSSFDVSQEGSQLFRSQRIKYIQRRIKEIEILVEVSGRQRTVTVCSPSTPQTVPEFS